MEAQPKQIALRPGDRLATFELMELLGKGGMGAVFKAIDRSLDREVALKTMDAAISADPVSLERFRLEAKTASQINHPNIVSIFSYGVERSIPYIAMELLAGQSLAAGLSSGPLEVERAADIMLGVCAGLFAAHAHGVIHRDLKPQNIFLTRTWLGETAKILDFGISKASGDPDLTDEDVVMGTPFYLAPEQVFDRKSADARVDQFAIGVILFQCIAGQVPYRSRSVKGHFQELGEGRYPRLSEFVSDVPPAFEAVVTQAMARRPSERFASARDLGRALLPFASFNSQRKWSEHYTAHKLDLFAAEVPRRPAAALKPPLASPLPRTEKLDDPPDGSSAVATVKTIRDRTPFDTALRVMVEGAPIPEYRPDFEKPPTKPSPPLDKAPEPVHAPPLPPTRQLPPERLENPWRDDADAGREAGALQNAPANLGELHRVRTRPLASSGEGTNLPGTPRSAGTDWKTVLIFVLVPLVGILLALLLLR